MYENGVIVTVRKFILWLWDLELVLSIWPFEWLDCYTNKTTTSKSGRRYINFCEFLRTQPRSGYTGKTRSFVWTLPLSSDSLGGHDSNRCPNFQFVRTQLPGYSRNHAHSVVYFSFSFIGNFKYVQKGLWFITVSGTLTVFWSVWFVLAEVDRIQI